MTPVIHLNGESRESHTGKREAVYTALREVGDLMRQCAPNMRDYYVKPDGGHASFNADCEEHYRRLGVLESLREVLVQEIELMES